MSLEDEAIWKRGKKLGQGACSNVYLDTKENSPETSVVKSCDLQSSQAVLPDREGKLLTRFKESPYIIRCLGYNVLRQEDGKQVYNLLLEYAQGGDLCTRINTSNGKGLPEYEVRQYTKCILKGLKFIHNEGYVHCDIKPDNILLVPRWPWCSSNYMAKIADFGHAIKKNVKTCARGTPQYQAPESVVSTELEPSCDVWAFGCVVLEMLTGRPAWDCEPIGIMYKLGYTKEIPKIPEELSIEAKDFLNKCFTRDKVLRWTPRMLLSHQFIRSVADVGDQPSDCFIRETSKYSEDNCRKRKRVSDDIGDGNIKQRCSKTNDLHVLYTEKV